MRAGHGSALLPVEASELLGGYGARTGGAEGVLDPIEVHAIVFGDGRTRVAVVVADVVCVNVDLVERVRAALTPLGIVHAWIAATHTHAAPETGCRPGGASTPPGIAARLIESTVAAVTGALNDERPVTLATRRVTVTGLGERRNLQHSAAETIPIDVLTLRDSNGDHRGMLVVSPVHPTVLPAMNNLASADLAGAIRRATVQRLGGWVVAATGAAGDVSTRTTRREQSPAEAERLAEIVAAAVSSGSVGSQEQWGTIRFDARSATLAPNRGLTSPPRDLDFGADRWADRRRTVYSEAMEFVESIGGHPAATVAVPVEAINLGGIGMVAVAGEPFLGVGERIRAGLDSPVIVLGYANGYVGYLPERDAPPSYETVVSPIDARSIDELIETAWHSAEAAGLSRAHPEK